MLVTTLCTVLRLVPVPSPTDVDRTASRRPPTRKPTRDAEERQSEPFAPGRAACCPHDTKGQGVSQQ
jgi:hypothetical protein